MTLLGRLNATIDQLVPYQPGKPIEEVARELGLDPRTIVKLASNENPLGASPRAVDAMQRSLRDVFRYPDGGAYRLRRRLAEACSVHLDQVIVGNGSNELLEFIGHCFITPRVSTVFSAHAFIIYKLATAMFGGRGIEVPMGSGLVHDLEAMADAVAPDTAVVFLCNPNNPTGTMVPAAAVTAFLERIPADVLVVLDEAYAEFAAAPMPPTRDYIRERPNVIMCRTFSKAYGLAGLRLGYAIGPAPLIQALQKARQPFNVNLMAQEAGLAALDDGAFLERVRASCAAAREQLEQGCRQAGLAFIPSAANFMLIEVGDGVAVTNALLERGVIVRPMAGYGLPRYIRATFGKEAENQRLLTALRELAA